MLARQIQCRKPTMPLMVRCRASYSFEMGARRLKRDLEALLGDYIGQRIRENSFDPKGKGTSSMLDDLVVAHYDLAISVALWWLNKEEGRYMYDRDLFGITSVQYPNHLEREAMILSSFAGMIMNKLPVDEILSLYKCKPAASYPSELSKATIVYPFTLSYHPFAMLASYKAVHHSKKHNDKLKRWQKANADAPTTQRSSSSSSQSFLSDSSEYQEERDENYEGSQESFQD